MHVPGPPEGPPHLGDPAAGPAQGAAEETEPAQDAGRRGR